MKIFFIIIETILILISLFSIGFSYYHLLSNRKKIIILIILVLTVMVSILSGLLALSIESYIKE